MIDPKEFFALFLPPKTLEYFDMSDYEIKEGKEKYMGIYGFDDEYTLVLVEKEKLAFMGQITGTVWDGTGTGVPTDWL